MNAVDGAVGDDDFTVEPAGSRRSKQQASSTTIAPPSPLLDNRRGYLPLTSLPVSVLWWEKPGDRLCWDLPSSLERVYEGWAVRTSNLTGDFTATESSGGIATATGPYLCLSRGDVSQGSC